MNGRMSEDRNGNERGISPKEKPEKKKKFRFSESEIIDIQTKEIRSDGRVCVGRGKEGKRFVAIHPIDIRKIDFQEGTMEFKSTIEEQLLEGKIDENGRVYIKKKLAGDRVLLVVLD